MGKKQTVSHMQARLAERLKQAHVEGETAQWLAVEIAQQSYLLPLAQAGEIFPWTTPETVPYTKPWFLGVVNLRGVLSGVVHLGRLREPQTMLTISSTSEARFVGFQAQLDVNSVLHIDRLLGLKNKATMTLQPNQDATASYLSNVYSDAQGQLWQEVSLQTLIQDADFLNISV